MLDERDVESLSREELLDYVYRLEAQLEALRGHRSIEAEANLQKTFKVPPMGAKLLALMSDGRVHAKSAILTYLYSGADEEPDAKIIDVFISQLRKKLAGTGINIETVWGVGYRIPKPAKVKQAMAGEDVHFSGEVPPPAIGRPKGARSAPKGSIRDKALEYLRSIAEDGMVRVAAKQVSEAVSPNRAGASILQALERGGHIAVLERPVQCSGGEWTIVLSEGAG